MGANRGEIERMIRAADAAGDGDSVRVLFGELDKLDAPPQAPVAPPESFPGGGGYNPMLSRLGGAAQSMGGGLGMTPENISNPLKNAMAPAEAALQAGTGGLGMAVGGLAGMGQGAWNAMVPKSMEGPQPADRVRQVSEALTYQPRSGAGAGMSSMATAPGAAWSAGTNVVGEKVADATGSPAAGAAVKTLGEVLPAAIGARSLPKPSRAPKGKYTPPAEIVPTTEQLSAAAKDAYKRADESGIAMKAESFEKMKGGLVSELQKDGLDPTLHPKATAALKRISEEQGPITLQKAETLRRIASDAMDTLEKSDARQAGKMVDAIDDYVDSVTDADLVSGSAKDAASLKEARALYTRKRKAEDIERLMERAKLSASGYENGLRIEFRSLAKNDRKMRRFTAEERASIKRVATGGTAENALRLVGKLAPTGIVSGALSSGAGAVAMGPGGAVAVPALGMVARKGAEKMTRRNAERAAVLMRRGPSASPLSIEAPNPQRAAPQAMPGNTAAPAAAKPRSVKDIQADIQRMSERARFELADAPAGSTKIQDFSAELARLQNELAATLIGQ